MLQVTITEMGRMCYKSLVQRWVKVFEVDISGKGKGVTGRYY